MRTQETMFKLVEEYENSGLTQREFAQQHEIKLPTFTYWLRKKRSASDSGFLELRPSFDLEDCLEIHYPNGVRIRTRRLDLIGTLIRLQ